MWGLWIVTRPTTRRLDPRRAIAILIVAGAPTAITLATGMLGLWDPSNMGRAIAGLPLGLVAGGLLGAIASKDLR